MHILFLSPRLVLLSKKIQISFQIFQTLLRFIFIILDLKSLVKLEYFEPNSIFEKFPKADLILFYFQSSSNFGLEMFKSI
jgi:hypothetical protein